ncbi:MAG: ABC transporter ATP-binding protein [Bacteroidetes bacterium]|nr:MAG: ABC transporter ATP-binding protein [Bacteroidota bacterium]TAG88501.1 MAG: ABC transporter ATP-binding protein [Bacteroidota bacterium]
MENQAILEVKNLSISFLHEKKYITAVDNISFGVYKGETLGIVGESGSGKSVTSLAIMGLLPIGRKCKISGEIWFRSRLYGVIDILKTPEHQLKEIRGKELGMIFQEPMTSLNPVYTCGNQVLEALTWHEKGLSKQDAKKRVIELFTKVELPEPEKKYYAYPHEISGGQKQRVMIAMALACNPLLLIADEPTTALDVTNQKTILDLLENLMVEFNTSILFITHDLGVIAEISDFVMVMYRGKVVEDGDLWATFNTPQHAYTKGLLACRPRLDIKMKILPTVSDFMEVDEKGVISEKRQGYNSVGLALLDNFVPDEDSKDHAIALQTKEPIIKIQNLKVYYPLHKTIFGKSKEFRKAVDDVSFDVYPGETIGLVGESGCGKSTIGRTLMRLIEPTAGKILFEGKDITEYNSRELRKYRNEMQIVFQDPYSSLNPRMTIGESILEPMLVHKIYENNKIRKEKVYELLEEVGLKSDFYNRYPHEFSGGQRQRICIARTLSMNPRFIVADESVSALDVSVQAQVLNLLNELKVKFNLTYIFISHDLSVVKFMADRIVVMNQGKIEEIDFAYEIYENPKTKYAQQLIAAIPSADPEDVLRRQRQRIEKFGAKL